MAQHPTLQPSTVPQLDEEDIPAALHEGPLEVSQEAPQVPHFPQVLPIELTKPAAPPSSLHCCLPQFP